MARLDGVTDSEAGLIVRSVFKAAGKRVGRIPEPLRIMAKSSGTMWAAGGFEMGFGRARAVPAHLKGLASLKVAGMVGCVF